MIFSHMNRWKGRSDYILRKIQMIFWIPKKTRGSLAKQSDCFCMAKTKRPKRKMVMAAYNRKILPRYPVNLKLYRKKNWKI